MGMHIRYRSTIIFTCVIMHGTTRILHWISVTCLRGPRLLIACNVHVSWKYTCGSTRVEHNTHVHSISNSRGIEYYSLLQV